MAKRTKLTRSLEDMAADVIKASAALNETRAMRDELLVTNARLDAALKSAKDRLAHAEASAEADSLLGRPTNNEARRLAEAEVADLVAQKTAASPEKITRLVQALTDRLEDDRAALEEAFAAESAAFDKRQMERVVAALRELHGAMRDLAAVRFWPPRPSEMRLYFDGLPPTLDLIEPAPPSSDAARLEEVLKVIGRADRAIQRSRG